MQALILAGGEGSRMSRVTAHLPKPLLYLPGGTLLEHQLALLSWLPISHTFVLISHHAEQMEQALHGWPDVTALRQSAPFTLLGALASAQWCLTERFAVLHGDNYFSHGLEYLLQEAQTAGGGSKPDAIFVVDAQAGEPDLARRLASTGCYLLSSGVFETLGMVQGGDELADLTGTLLEQGAALEEVHLRGWRENINHLQDLLRVSRRILEGWSASYHPPGAAGGYNRVGAGFEAEPPVWISRDSEVVDSHLGPCVVVGPRARVRSCRLREVIVFPDAEIVDQRFECGVVLPGGTGRLLLSPQDEVDACDSG